MSLSLVREGKKNNGGGNKKEKVEVHIFLDYLSSSSVYRILRRWMRMFSRIKLVVLAKDHPLFFPPLDVFIQSLNNFLIKAIKHINIQVGK